MTARPFRWTLILAVAMQSAAARTEQRQLPAAERPQLQAKCDGVPIRRCGFCWVLGEAPTLLDDTSLQAGNSAPRVKVHPKDSSRIKRNYLGVTTTRMPSILSG